jgi:hypothetical protein
MRSRAGKGLRELRGEGHRGIRYAVNGIMIGEPPHQARGEKNGISARKYIRPVSFAENKTGPAISKKHIIFTPGLVYIKTQNYVRRQSAWI